VSGVSRARWITFDCFGTLVDWQGGFASALAPVAGDRTMDLVRAYLAHERLVEREAPHRSYKDVLARALVRAAGDCGIRLSSSDETLLARRWSALRPFDDVEPMLRALRAMGYRLAVLTNCDDDLFEITHRMFSEPFDFFLTAERVRGYKPAPWHFLAFERVTGVRREDWVHVACSWYHDIEPAHALGVRSVWLDRERTGEDPSRASACVRTVDDVLRVLPAVFREEVPERALAGAPGTP
jgi:2-haloacid dehalogenase